MAPRAPDILESLQDNIAAVFDQAQVTLANHRKNCVALYKLHQQAAEVTKVKEGSRKSKLVGEKSFSDVFLHLLNRVLVVKKGPPAADKVVKFVGAYIKFMNERIIAEQATNANTSQPEELEETFASRFVDKLMNYMVEGFIAKNKATRYRCISTVSEMIGHLGVIDEDLYEPLRDGLIERASDKEALIRANAIIALSKLAGSEDPDEIEEGTVSILDVIIESLCHDSAPEVRRAALVNIPLFPNTLPVILSRTRDTDALTRKLIYSNVLTNKLGDPRRLSIEQRETVVKDGLGDREAAVRVAAGKLCVSWFDLVCSSSENVKKDEEDEGPTWEGDDGGIMKGLIKFLSLFDVVAGEEAAKDALESIFVTKPAVLDAFTFPDDYWKQLSPESAMLARVFMEHCLSKSDEARLESAGIPVVMAFAFTLQMSYNSLVDLLQEVENQNFLGGRDDEEEAMRQEEELAKMEVVLRELLRIAWKLDYMDEIGRRKTFAVVRDMLAHPELPPGLINPALDVLKKITGTERDLIRVMVEIIVDLREEDEAEQEIKDLLNDDLSEPDTNESAIKDRQAPRRRPREEMSPEERVTADEKDLRCLTLCIGMLERVDGDFEDNSTLQGVLGDLIIPSVKRKEVPLREKGLACLGLCSLLTKDMALKSFQLFIGQAQSDNEEIQLRALQIIFDLLVVYDQELLKRSEEMANSLITFLLTSLENAEFASVRALICVGLSKLLLSGLVTELKVLNHLVNAYISPDTAPNQSLRQCLSYFFPVYCYSSPVNQRRMAQIFLPTYDAFLDTRSVLEEDEEMVTPQTFGLLFVDWTDPAKCKDLSQPKEADGWEPEPKEKYTGPDAHYDLAIELLKAAYDDNRTVEDLKLFCQLLTNLNLKSTLEPRLVHTINVLVRYHEQQSPFNDDPTLKLFKKFETKFKKACGETLKATKIKDILDDDLVQTFRYVNVEPPHGDEEYDALDDGDEVTSSRATSLAPTSTSRAGSVASVRGKDTDDQDGEDEGKDEEQDENQPKERTSRSKKGPKEKARANPRAAGSKTEAEDDVDDEPEGAVEEEVLTARPGARDPASRKRGTKRSSSESETASQAEPEGREKRTRVSAPARGGTVARARGRGRAKAVGRSTRGKAKGEEKASVGKGKAKASGKAPGRGKGRGKAREDTPEDSDEEAEVEDIEAQDDEEEDGATNRTISPPPEAENRRKSTRERKSIRQSLAEPKIESDDEELEEDEEEDEEHEEDLPGTPEIPSGLEGNDGGTATTRSMLVVNTHKQRNASWIPHVQPLRDLDSCTHLIMSPHRAGGSIAPYLTHEVSHHGQVTLVPPDNAGRIRQAPRQSGKEARSRPRQERTNRAEDEPRFNVGPRSFRALALNRGARRAGRSDRNHIEPFYEAAYPDYPPPSFQEAMAETATGSSTNVMNDASGSLPPSEPGTSGLQDRPQLNNDVSFCSSNSSRVETPRESDAESISSLEIVEAEPMQEQARVNYEERMVKPTVLEFPSSHRKDNRASQEAHKITLDQDSDEDEPQPPQPQSPTKRRNLSLSPLRTLFPYRNAEPHRVHSALPTANPSPYSHHTPFMSATSLPMKMSMSTTSFATSLRAESFLSRKLLSFKGKERANNPETESLDEPWEVVERETPSLSSVARKMESQPGSPPGSPVTANCVTPPSTPPHTEASPTAVERGRAPAPPVIRSLNEPHPLSRRDKKVPLLPKHISRPHRQRHATRPELPRDLDAPLGPIITTVRTRAPAAGTTPPLSQPVATTQRLGEQPPLPITSLPPPQALPPPPPPPPPVPPPSYTRRTGDKTPPRVPRSPLHQSVTVPEPPMTPLFLTPPTTPVKSTSDSQINHGPAGPIPPQATGNMAVQKLPAISADLRSISPGSTPYQTPRQGMSPNHSTTDLLELAVGSSPSTPRRHYTGRPLPRPPGALQRVIDSVYAGNAESNDPVPNCCPEGLLIDLDDDGPSSASVTPTGSLLLPSTIPRVQPKVSVPISTTSSTSSLEEIPRSPIEGPATPPGGPPRPAQRQDGPFLEVTDLDMLVNRLDQQTGPSNGSDYDTLLTLTDFMGPASPETVILARQAACNTDKTSDEARSPANENIALTAQVMVGRRRTTKDGRVKLKLKLMDISVDRCGICLNQFKETDIARLGSICKHAFHGQCLSRWLAHNQSCPMCRVALYDH